MGRVQRHVAGPGPHRPEVGADRPPAPRQADGHHVFGLDSGGEESRRNRAGAGVELGVGQPLLAVLEGDRIGPLCGALADEPGEGQIHLLCKRGGL